MPPKKKTGAFDPDTMITDMQAAAAPLSSSALATSPAPMAEPPVPPRLPLPLSSFRVDVGGVDEVTWTQEDLVIRALKWNRSEQQIMQARVTLRRAAKHGTIVARRNPEHGWWEYGPQWRSKDFQTLLDAAHSAALLGATPGAVT